MQEQKIPTLVPLEEMTDAEIETVIEQLRAKALANYIHGMELLEYQKARKNGVTHAEFAAAGRERAAQRAATSTAEQLEAMRRDLDQVIAVEE